MNPEKELVCECGAKAKNDSKHRGRFLRRHGAGKAPKKCAEFHLIKSAMELNAAGVKSVEDEDGKRVDMSGDAAGVGAVDGEALPGVTQ